jgi:hypothetical protein
MSGYDIYLSSGTLLTTVNVKTVDTQESSSIFLIGQGIPDYGTMVAQDFIWMLENFSASTPPVNPLEGQIWHDRTRNREAFWNGSLWVHMVDARSTGSGLFNMLPASQDIDFTVTGSTVIFTGGAGHNFYPSIVLLVPNGTISATVGPTFNVFVSSAGDVLPSTTVAAVGTTLSARYPCSQTAKFVNGAQSLTLQVTAGATGGLAAYNVYVFGLIL